MTDHVIVRATNITATTQQYYCGVTEGLMYVCGVGQGCNVHGDMSLISAALPTERLVVDTPSQHQDASRYFTLSPLMSSHIL